MKKTRAGFTIVELLIVIVVIAILAAITVVAYSGIQERARNAKLSADMAQLEKAILIARILTDKPLHSITGTNYTQGSCMSGTNIIDTQINNLPKSDPCWTDYKAALNAISTASGTSLSSLMNGSPWGGPYLIDENEGESAPEFPDQPCHKDTLAGANYLVQTAIIRFIPLWRPNCVIGSASY